MFLFFRNCCQLRLKFTERSLLPQDVRSSIWLTLKLRSIVSALAKLLEADMQLFKKNLNLSKKKLESNINFLKQRAVKNIKAKNTNVFVVLLYYFCGDNVCCFLLFKERPLNSLKTDIKTEILLDSFVFYAFISNWATLTLLATLILLLRSGDSSASLTNSLSLSLKWQKLQWFYSIYIN